MPVRPSELHDVVMQPLPDPSAVAPLLDPAGTGDEAGIARLLVHAAEAAWHATGGVGFNADGTTVEPELAAVIVRGVARSLLNPELPLALSDNPFATRPGGFANWSDDDLAVLTRLRSRRAGVGS